MKRKAPCGGCKDTVTLSAKAYDKLSANALAFSKAEVEVRQLRALLSAVAKSNDWREEGTEHGYQMRHNPEVCDECYAEALQFSMHRERARPTLPTDPLSAEYQDVKVRG